MGGVFVNGWRGCNGWSGHEWVEGFVNGWRGREWGGGWEGWGWGGGGYCE